MKKTLVPVIAGLFLLTYPALASDPDFATSIASRFSRIWRTAPEEKVYLHTDKPYYYSAGDDIWFRAHLVNAATHKPDTRSQFVYVELIDKSDFVYTRVKLKKNDDGIAGKISLSPETPPGEYLLRAYTYWMQNVSADFFFHKKIHIGNLIDDRVRINTTYGTPENGKTPVTITFTNTFSMPLSGKTVSVKQDFLKKNKNTVNLVTNKQGEIHFLVDNEQSSKLKRMVDVSLNEPGLVFNRKIHIPDVNDDYDVQFFPESGVFLDNQIQTVAFKAIGMDGLSTTISGKIFNLNQEEICDVKSLNMGMGKIILQTIPGEQYFALITNEAGLEKKFYLPETTSEGIGLKLLSVRGKIYFKVLNQSLVDTENLFLMAHTRGIVYFVSPINKSEGVIPGNLLPDGIVTFSIIDSTGNTWCERLSFIRNDAFPTITMNSDKQIYDKREAVELSFKISSTDNKPALGSYSVSVTDNTLVKDDSINNNIMSYLLLSSDLKGFIESPQQYFTDNSAMTIEKTDILMLTQGWRRFDTKAIVNGNMPKTDYYLEAGQAVSGKVLNIFNKPVKDSEVIFFSNYKNQINVAKSDSSGQFIIEGIEFPDSTQIILKAKSRSKIADVELIPDPDTFPAPKNNIPFTSRETSTSMDDYLHLSKEKYYNEGGMLVVNLDEFTVRADTKKTDNEYYYSGMADNSIDSKKLESFGNLSVLDIIRTFPGVMVSEDAVSIRGSSGNPLFLIDGVETEELEDVKFLYASDIEEISLFKGASASMFGSRGGNGAIAITLKKGVSLQHITPPSLVHFTPLGYQLPAAFYVPKYEIDSVLNQTKPDLRTTIYWAPKVQTDEDGNIHLKFYTADKPNDYRVELEGVSNEGEICKYQNIIRRK